MLKTAIGLKGLVRHLYQPQGLVPASSSRNKYSNTMIIVMIMIIIIVITTTTIVNTFRYLFCDFFSFSHFLVEAQQVGKLL